MIGRGGLSAYNAPTQFASAAEVLAGTATGKAVDPAGLLASWPRLTDYQRVVVVDPGGKGDHTTLSAAFAAISDAASNSRYLVIVFGAIAESGDLTFEDYVDVQGWLGATVSVAGDILFPTSDVKVSGLTLISTDIANKLITFSGSASLDGCALSGFLDAAAGAVQVTLTRCQVDGAFQVEAGTVLIRHCLLRHTQAAIDNSFNNLVIVTAGTAEVEHSVLQEAGTATSSVKLLEVANGATLKVRHCDVYQNGAGECFRLVNGAVCNLYSVYAETGTNGYGVNISSLTPTLVATKCHFKSATAGRAVRAASAWNPAPFYDCIFENGVTNITCGAGTANGSSLAI